MRVLFFVWRAIIGRGLSMNRVLGFALISILLNAQSNPEDYSAVAKSTAESIDAWQKDTNITVDAGAHAELAHQVEQADWSKVYVPPDHREQAMAWTKDVLVRAYLYSFLDRNRALHGVTAAQLADHTFADFTGTLTNEPFGFVEFLSAPAGAAIRRDEKEIGRTPMGFIAGGDAHNYDIVLTKEITCESTIRTRPGTTDRMTCPE